MNAHFELEPEASSRTPLCACGCQRLAKVRIDDTPFHTACLAVWYDLNTTEAPWRWAERERDKRMGTTR